MKVVSTRTASKEVLISEAILEGLAPDGGLYVPLEWVGDLSNCLEKDFVEYAYKAISPYFRGDDLFIYLRGFIERAFNFPVSLNFYEKTHALLELHHGPTAAFKDFGARFLAEVLSKISEKVGNLTILVATSGDTGGAVASAFYKKVGINVIVLYPKGMVSRLQEKQLTCWGGNITSLRVDGTFDDCQSLVKAAFNDSKIKSKFKLTSANSINLGRLLPQMAYQAYSSQLFYNKTKIKPNLIIPSGNLGNSFGAFWAKKIGAPIDNILLATNANNTLTNFYISGKYKPKTSVQTLANAMDVGDPSNIERIINLFPTIESLKQISSTVSINDEEIIKEISNFHSLFHTPICPHTAVGTLAAKNIFDNKAYIVSATAHASKFQETVEPAIGQELILPPKLKSLMNKESFVFDIDNDLESLIKYFRS